MKKIIHQIWLGTAELPSWYPRYRKSWRSHFPQWEHRLWTDADLTDLRPRFLSCQAFDRNLNVGLRSDILRLELLKSFGGIYVDIDFECLRNFENLLKPDHFTCAYEQPDATGNAFLASPDGHPFIDRYLQSIESYLSANPDSLPDRVQTISGPVALRRTVENSPDLALSILPQSQFYPYWCKGDGRKQWEDSVFHDRVGRDYPEAVAVHHWAKTW